MTELDPFQKLEVELDHWGAELIKARPTFETLDDDKKDILASIMNQYIEEPVNRREVKARASEKWKQYKVGLAVSRENYSKANVMFTITRIKIDTLRTKYSYKKAQMNLV